MITPSASHRRAALFGLLFATSVASANMLNNSSFEQAGETWETARHWRMDDPDDHGDAWGAAIRSNWRAIDGYHAGAIRGGWAGVGDYGGFWQEVHIEPGMNYKAMAWFWADAAWRSDVQEMKLEFWNEDRTEMVGDYLLRLESIGESWTPREITLSAPPNAAWGRVVINVSGIGHHGSLQVDKIELHVAQ